MNNLTSLGVADNFRGRFVHLGFPFENKEHGIVARGILTAFLIVRLGH